MRKFVRFEKITVSDGKEIHSGEVYLIEGKLLHVETEFHEVVVNFDDFTSNDGETLIFKKFVSQEICLSDEDVHLVKKIFGLKSLQWWQKEETVLAATEDSSCVSYLRYLRGK